VTIAEKVDVGNGDLFEMLTYMLVILISSVIMIIWLKRRARRKRK
jgi:hypothetical protein